MRTLAAKVHDVVHQYDEEKASALLESTEEDMKRKFFMGRSFRVGWGPGGKLICPQVRVRAETTEM